MARRSLLKDVSYDELMTMRGMGMSNAEIADNLGVSYATVLHAIGRQPSRSELTAQPKEEKSVQGSSVVVPFSAVQEELPTMPAPKSTLTVRDRTVQLHGCACLYTISYTNKFVKLINCSDEVLIPFEKLQAFAEELREIQYNVETGEAW